jgi:hypothetical protein
VKKKVGWKNLWPNLPKVAEKGLKKMLTNNKMLSSNQRWAPALSSRSRARRQKKSAKKKKCEKKRKRRARMKKARIRAFYATNSGMPTLSLA